MKTKKKWHQRKRRIKTSRHHDNHLEKNDFYTFVNKPSLTQHETKYLNKVDDFRVVQYKVFDDLYALIRRYLSTHSHTHIGKALQTFLHSSAAFNSVTNSKAYLQATIEQLDKVRNEDHDVGIWKMLATANRNDLTNSYAPLVWRKAPDFEQPSVYVDYLTPHQFAIFDVSAYNKKETGYRELFQKYVDSLFQTTLPQDSSLNADDVLQVAETFLRLINKSYNHHEDKQSKFGYTKVERKEALNRYGFDWDTYCLALGYTEKQIPSFFYVENIGYFRHCVHILRRAWNSKAWRSYWVWLIARYVARLTSGWETVFYNFYGKQTQGLESSIRSVRTHAMVNSCIYAFGGLLHNLYIDFAFNNAAIKYTRNLAEELRKTLLAQLERNTWLTTKTRSSAIDKITHVAIQVGSTPFQHLELPTKLAFNTSNYLDNFLKVGAWRHQFYLNSEKSVIETLTSMDFTKYPAQIQNMPSFQVNALYSAQTNRIQITTAYLQKPFLGTGVEYNVAYMGWTIAHELTHALDNIGSLYDQHGKLRDWWTKDDRARYHRLQQELLRQYQHFAQNDTYFRDKDFAFTMDEDLADISGLQICQDYLLHLGREMGWTPSVTEHHMRQFFVYFARHMHQQIQKQSTRYQLITNPHPIDKFRTNVPLSRSSLFRQMFGIAKGDGMFWKDNQQGIWS